MQNAFAGSPPPSLRLDFQWATSNMCLCVGESKIHPCPKVQMWFHCSLKRVDSIWPRFWFTHVACVVKIGCLSEYSFSKLSILSGVRLFLNSNCWERELKSFLTVSPLSLSGSSSSPPSPLLPCCVLKHWHLCLCGRVGGSVRPPRWRSQQSCALHVNKTSAPLRGPRLSACKSHQTTLGPEKTSAAHANVLWLGFPQQPCGLCAQTHRLRWFWMLIAPGWSHRIKSLRADQMTTNGGHSDDLKDGRLLFLDNNQRDRGPVSRPVYGAHTAQKRANRCRATHRLLLP